MSFHVPEQYRVPHGPLGSTCKDGNNGAFLVPHPTSKHLTFGVIASDGEGWEHVSVSFAVRTPTWKEMCFIKELFWDPEDWVVQYHPGKDAYVNVHPFALHLWRPIDRAFPCPARYMV